MSVNNGEMSEGIETPDLSARGTTQEGSVEAENGCIKRGGNLLQKFEFAARVGEGIIGAVGMYVAGVTLHQIPKVDEQMTKSINDLANNNLVYYKGLSAHLNAGIHTMTCQCLTPSAGTTGHNEYKCTDGTQSFCAADQECYSKLFNKGDWDVPSYEVPAGDLGYDPHGSILMIIYVYILHAGRLQYEPTLVSFCY